MELKVNLNSAIQENKSAIKLKNNLVYGFKFEGQKGYSKTIL
jgi:hypothetical protein